MTGLTRGVTQDVDAPVEQVWEMVSDLTRMGEWSPENRGGQWLSGTPGQVGARFKGRNKRGRVAWSTTCEVIASEPGRVFAFVVGSPDRPSATWRYELDPLPGSRTRVRESFLLPGPAGRLERLVTRLTLGVTDREADLEDSVRHTLSSLAEAARRAPAAPPG